MERGSLARKRQKIVFGKKNQQALEFSKSDKQFQSYKSFNNKLKNCPLKRWILLKPSRNWIKIPVYDPFSPSWCQNNKWLKDEALRQSKRLSMSASGLVNKWNESITSPPPPNFSSGNLNILLFTTKELRLTTPPWGKEIVGSVISFCIFYF